MDKVKDIIFLVFSKHLFWTLSFIIFVMGFVAWWMSASTLDGEYTTNEGKIKTTHSTADQVLNTPPDQVYNQATHEGMEAENLRRSKDVYLAWRAKYSRQRKDVLVWPEGLSSTFLRQIEKILGGKPIEEVDIGADRDLITTQREEFRTQISTLLPELASAINAKWDPTSPRSGSSGRSGGRVGTRAPVFGGGEGGGRNNAPVAGEEVDETTYAVNWDSADQASIQARHFNFYETADPPTTIEILYAMEDYWVLKALMQIVARTNTDDSGRLADAPYKATIREIQTIDIGKEVETRVGQVTRLASTSTEGGEGEVASSEGRGADPTMGSEGGEGGVLSEAALQVDQLSEGRYVDGKQQPVPAAVLKSAATGKNEEEAYLAVAKRMPVRMRLKMDQRKLNKFLVECGNGDLMLEVLQVRINPDAGDVLQSSGSSGGRAPAFGGGRTRGSESGGTTNTGIGEEYPWDVVVEIYGIIYIFNPPSIDRLGLTAEDKVTLDSVDLGDEAAVEAAAAEPSEAAPPTEPGDEAAADADPEAADPADAEPPADKPVEDKPAAPAPPAAARVEPPVQPAPAG